MTRDELLDLLGALADGTISADDHARLERELESNPDARRTYFDYIDLHLGLRQTAQARRLPAGRRRRRIWGVATAAAALLMAALTVWRPAPPAQLSRSASARFFGPAPAVGDPLELGREYALIGGRVELAFSSGAVVLLDAPAAFEIRDPLRMALKYGRGTVQVDDRSKGFVVETPSTRVVDRGTRFALRVDEGGESEVHVLEGAADLLGGSAPKRLEQGDAARAAGGSVSAIPYDVEGFPLEIPDRVVSYEATTAPNGGAKDLVAVTVRRGGREIRYPVERLTGVRIVHYKVDPARGNWVSSPLGVVPSPGTRRAYLESDRDLNTGLVNFGTAREPLASDPVMNDPEDPARPNTPGLGFRFLVPVVNDVGPDVVIFEYQPVIQPEVGDPFHLSPLRFEPGLRGRTYARWDFTIYSPEALRIAGFRLNTFKTAPASLSAYEAAEVKTGNNFTILSKALAVAIDLSDLGYAQGARVEGLFMQDAFDGDSHQVDPVFIGGLPPLER